MGKESAPPAPDYAAAAKATAAGNMDASRSATIANRVNTFTPYGNLTYAQDKGAGSTFDQAGYDAATQAYQANPGGTAATAATTGNYRINPANGENEFVPGTAGTPGTANGTAPSRDQFTHPGNPDGGWSSTVSLDPSQQHLLDASNQSSLQLAGMQGSAANRVGGAMNSPLPGVYNPTQATNNAADLMNARLLPQQQRDQAAMNTQLANQGITQGSQAYQQAQDQLGRTQNDARQQSQLAGITMGQNQQGQQYAQGVANRNMPMNDFNALRTGSQVTNPTFSNAPQQQTVAGPDMLGAANSSYHAAMQGVNASNANSGNMMNGLMGMGATYAGSAAGSAAIAAMF